ncbi:hypothetical protein I316_03592 [Kwoniella heveanensis BCC8398]|uniref:Uncharacterized protein n=1 Tax=Kwoniella heveanensis BCC8398 TaxID=1296120 RepID=A0A1B9GU14_9TREE|nr:hypothetical protein I316_03592 [Kwoniella heveanensis BCC8398]
MVSLSGSSRRMGGHYLYDKSSGVFSSISNGVRSILRNRSSLPSPSPSPSASSNAASSQVPSYTVLWHSDRSRPASPQSCFSPTPSDSYRSTPDLGEGSVCYASGLSGDDSSSNTSRAGSYSDDSLSGGSSAASFTSAMSGSRRSSVIIDHSAAAPSAITDTAWYGSGKIQPSSPYISPAYRTRSSIYTSSRHTPPATGHSFSQRNVHFDGGSASGSSHYPFSSAREHSDAVRATSTRWRQSSVYTPRSGGEDSSSALSEPGSYSESGQHYSGSVASTSASALSTMESAAISLLSGVSRLSGGRRK